MPLLPSLKNQNGNQPPVATPTAHGCLNIPQAMRISVIIAFICVFLAGCRNFETHPWTSPDNSERFFNEPPVAELDRIYIAPDSLFRPSSEKQAEAESLLSSHSFIEISKAQFSDLTGIDWPEETERRAYLIRAVAWSDPPWYSLVFFDRTTGLLYTEQFTWNGEIYFPGSYRSFALPMIALLSREPVEVKSYGIWGGDWIMARWNAPNAWKDGIEPNRD